MKKLLMLSLLALALVSCAGSDEEVVHDPAVDSLIKPQAPVATGDAIELDTTTGFMVDKSRIRSPDHISTMERFEPTQVVSIYTEFRPIRKPSLSKSSLDSFLKHHDVNEKELRAILYEGDQLGWDSAVKITARPK